MRTYPCMEIFLKKIEENTKQVLSHCQKKGISVCGVVKGCSGLNEVAKTMKDNGCAQLGSSRLEQIRKWKEYGIPGPYMLIRIPGFSEIQDCVELCDYSIHSELSVLNRLNTECIKQNKTHKAILIVDLGDTREGFWDKEEFLNACVYVENNLSHVELAGIAVNLGCIGSVKPTVDKMQELLLIKDRIEAIINRSLEIVSGGSTSTYPLVQDNLIPEGINHLRIGEGILLASDLQVLWGIQNLSYLHMDSFILHTEVIEIKEKPSYPQGELICDAFGHVHEYVDKGIRKRAIVAIGEADVGDASELIPLDKQMTIDGYSSDHTVVDITDCERDYQVGDIIDFQMRYQHMLHASSCDYVRVLYKG